jgi:hypothetical protein
MHVSNLAILDYPKIPDALGPNWQTASVPATISIDVVWDGPVTRRVNIQGGTNGDHFAGEFEQNQVTVTWSGANASGFSFTGNPGTLATTTIPGFAFAEVGHMASGIFAPDGSGQTDGADAALGQAFAAPTSPDGSGALPSSAVDAALGGSPTAAPTAPWQPLPLGGLNNQLAGDVAADLAALDGVARDHAAALATDPVAAFLLFPDAGQAGAGVLAR